MRLAKEAFVEAARQKVDLLNLPEASDWGWLYQLARRDALPPAYIGVSALAVNNVDGNLYVGISGGRGLYRSPSPVQTPNPPAITNSISLALTSDATPHQFDLSYIGAGNYPLQCASNLSSPVWLPVSNVTWTANSNTNTATIRTNAPALFFRLAK
jgi:hypothetical protein